MKNSNANKDMPFPRSYWVAPGLMAGCYPGADNEEETQSKLKGLLDAGIRRVINLMAPDETNRDEKPFASYENQMRTLADTMGITVTFNRMPIQDMSIPTEAHMVRILDLIDRNIRNDQPVYIHCWGGRGRTGTVVGCYLIRHGYASGQKAIDLIEGLRRETEDYYKASPETSEQIAMILGWGEGG
jgi:protein-tyrosine phosphatase